MAYEKPTSSYPLPVSPKKKIVRLPGLLIAHAPSPETYGIDRCSIDHFPFIVGRSSDATLTSTDGTCSSIHCHITHEKNEFYIEDLGSHNGTYVDGALIDKRMRLSDQSVIRVGGSVLVFWRDVGPMLNPPKNRRGIVGKFHVSTLMDRIEKVALSGDHILIAGPSGAGKELAAEAIRKIIGKKPFVAHNAADYASEDEAIITLYGVAKGAFTGVEKRRGRIMAAHNGTLFLDEFHRYPARIQTSLLRGMETGEYRSPGEDIGTKANVRFLLATNVAQSPYGLIEDLLGRTHLVVVPSLSERKADIPSLFDYFLGQALESRGIPESPVLECINVDHYEALMLHDFKRENIRSLKKIAHILVADLQRGTKPTDAVFDTFYEHFGGNFVQVGRQKKKKLKRKPLHRAKGSTLSTSIYHQHRKEIEVAYREERGNINAMLRRFEAQGIHLTHRWLTKFCVDSGLKKVSYQEGLLPGQENIGHKTILT
ncbi:MAG: sigma-54-dependent Fis family transcriptional regulator [Deltaproteobacteria bacterium]|nr:sigma-54-dependent Fis family transcriptional regulator [Deltaproteobacteria bacterium]